MAARVSGGGDGQQIRRNPLRLGALDLALDPGDGLAAMADAVAAEVPPEAGVVGDVIPMGEEHALHAAEILNAPQKRAGRARRIHQNVSFRPNNKIARCSERGFRREAAIENAIFNGLGKQPRGSPGIDLRGRADGAGRAGDERHQRPGLSFAAGWLTVNERFLGFGRPGEGDGGQLPAGVAVDAGGVNEKIPRNVLRQSQIQASHYSYCRRRSLWSNIRKRMRPEEDRRAALRASHQVRILTDSEEGSGVYRLPAGVYGFTYAPLLDNFPLFQTSRLKTFEIHKLADGSIVLVGFVNEQAASELENAADEIRARLFPDAREDAATLVAIPLSRVNRIKEHSTRTTGGLELNVEPLIQPSQATG